MSGDVRAESSELTVERLRSVLNYDQETGRFVWRPRPVETWPDRTWNTRFAGSFAGTRIKDGRLSIRIDGMRYLASRLAWLYVTGSWPTSQVDHRDCVKSNDRWDNLRLATTSQNGANTNKRSNNTSGYKGVTWARRRKKWQAQIAVRGKHLYLGQFDSANAAAKAYAAAAVKYHGEFART